MTVEFIGMIASQEYSEIIPASGPAVDPAFTARFARAHEESGFDRVLVGYGATWPDGWAVASYALAKTDRLGVLLAHRPGFVAPTLAARKLATLDQFAAGRLAVHIITGGSDLDQARDGDIGSTKEQRYRRTDEYLTVLRKELTATEPFDFDGEFYHVRGAISTVKSVTQPHLPIYFGGSSEEAINVAGRHADVYALWGEPLADASNHITRVKAVAARHGRNPGISVSFRPILAATDDLAWERAYAILDQIEQGTSSAGFTAMRQALQGSGGPQNVGSQRLLAAAARGDRHDRALFTKLAAATGAAGNSTALVGSPETVAQALIDYYKIGVTTFLIRGYNPYDDAIDYGRALIPRVRQLVSQLEKDKQSVAVSR
jgi:alkanesulfonate monooxygenase